VQDGEVRRPPSRDSSIGHDRRVASRLSRGLKPHSTLRACILRGVPSSEALTRGVRIVVNARYSSSHSDPAKREWFFLYTITITNEGDETVQLVNRHWVIMNANGHVEEVRGPGVVGNQPTLKTGESFEYTSGCPLKTPFGSMHGDFEMVTADGEAFLAEIAAFALRESETFH
jgi:ApaG protein